MAIRWHDVTIPLREGMAVWPGDPPFEFTPVNRITAGAACNTSRAAFSTHLGTHVDAPWHFEENGKRLHELDHVLFFGEARLIEIPGVDIIHAEDLGESPLPQRILIKTRNSAYPDEAPFRTDYVALAEDAARRIVEEGVKLVGVDYLSVAPYKQKGHTTHHCLLGNGIIVVEGLRLKGFPSGSYLFTMLPLALAGADGAPCRAFLGIEENGR
jgi:arylformamidase